MQCSIELENWSSCRESNPCKLFPLLLVANIPFLYFCGLTYEKEDQALCDLRRRATVWKD